MPHAVATDPNEAHYQPVLQSTVALPTHAAPPEDRHALLQHSLGQVAGVIAFVANTSDMCRGQLPVGD